MADLVLRIEELEKELKDKDELLHKAGQIGKTLLEQNADYQNQMEERDNEYQMKLEAASQEIHGMHKSLDQKVAMERIYQEEMEALKQSLECARRQQEFDDEAAQNHKMSQMKKKQISLQMEVDRLLLAESQLQLELESAHDKYTSLKRDLTNQDARNNETCSDEISRLHSELQHQREEREELAKLLQLEKKMCEQLTMRERHLSQEVTSAREELEEKECQIITYQNALERSREETQELQVQLEVQRMESMNKASKGNSLFSELEDRRIRAELEVNKLRLQFESMKKKHAMVAEQMHRYQSQMLVCMQAACSQIDETRLKTLERDAYVARKQIEHLTKENVELKHREKVEMDLRVLDAIASGSKSDVDAYVRIRMENKSKEISDIKRDLSDEKFKRMSFESSLMEKESRLYNLEKQLRATNTTCAQLRLQVEKLKLKYEPECQGEKTERRLVETIPLVEITDKCKSNNPTEHAVHLRRNAVSDPLESTNTKKKLDLLELLAKPKTSTKRVKINDTKPDVTSYRVESDEQLDISASKNETECESKRKPSVDACAEKESICAESTTKSRGKEVHRKSVHVTGENKEECKTQ